MHQVATYLLAMSLMITVADACFAWGGCGFGGCGMRCGGIGICRKAHGARTLREEEKAESSGDPDTDFRACCESSGIPTACHDKCNYKKFTKDAMVRMFLRLDECPVTAAVEMQRCATRGADHTDCCKRNAVHTTLAGEKCLIFCKEDSGNATLLDISYIPCLERFDSVNSCFWHDAVREIADTDRMLEEKISAREDQEVAMGVKQIVRPPVRSGIEARNGVEREERQFVGIQRDEVREHTSKWEMAKRRMLDATDDDDYEEFVDKK